MSAEAQTAPAAPQAAAAPAPGTPWSLDDCIGYALANNIDVQQRALQVEQNEVELSTAKYSRLPDLNASIGGDASFGRVLSSDNTYKDNNQTSGSLNISTSLPVFQGMRINRQVKGGKLDLAAAMQDLERAREDVSINVMTLYLEVLYNKELTDVAERQLALSTLQATQSRELVAAGKQPESARYESEALMAKDQLSLTQARNDLQLALLNLSQALNRESAAGFDVVVRARQRDARLAAPAGHGRRGLQLCSGKPSAYQGGAAAARKFGEFSPHCQIGTLSLHLAFRRLRHGGVQRRQR